MWQLSPTFIASACSRPAVTYGSMTAIWFAVSIFTMRSIRQRSITTVSGLWLR